MRAKVVRAIAGVDFVSHDTAMDAFAYGDEVMALPAADYDAMVEREREARWLAQQVLNGPFHWPTWEARARAFLAETKGET